MPTLALEPARSNANPTPAPTRRSAALAARRRAGAVLAAASCVLAALGPRPAGGAIACTPEIQWTWDGDVSAPDHPHPCNTPLVAQLTDDDGNGVIDADDLPDVVFVHYALPVAGERDGRITAVDGLTGAEHFTAVSGGLYSAGLSAADIDGDGVVELLALEATGEHVLAFENDGSFKWSSDIPSVLFTFLDTIGVADLDQDGSAEIIVGSAVFDAEGRLEWEGSEGRGEQFIGAVSHAVDLAPDSPGLELLAGDTLYDAQGGILWQAGGVTDGWTSVADFDGDGDPEIAHVSIGVVHLLDHEGNPLTPVYTFGSTPASQPVAADLDGDGDAELFLMQADEVRALDLVAGDWVDLWSQPTEDPSRINGAAAFDFDGDGVFEILYHDMVAWYIFDGPTGAVLHQEPFLSATGIETPVLADIDNDCLTEILVSGCAGNLGDEYPKEVRAYECAPAARARPIWNQYGYHVGNVLDDGSLPIVEQPAWLDHNTWMGQVSTAVGAIATAGAVTPLRICRGDGVFLDGSPSTGCTNGYEYRFAEGTAPICGWSPDPLCEVSPPGPANEYMMHVRCTGEPCEDQAEIIVEVDPMPSAAASRPAPACAGETVVLDGGISTGCPGGYEYRFLDGATEACGWSPAPTCEVSPSVPSTRYTLQVRCAGGTCEDQTEVIVPVGAPPTAVAPTPLRACAGEGVVLDGSLSTGCPGGYEYRFSDGAAAICEWSSEPRCEAVPAASPTEYVLQVRCAGEVCEDQTDILVELDPVPSADAGPPATLCTGQATRIGGSPTAAGGSGSYTYLWESSPPGAIAAGEETLANPSTMALSEPTVFTVTVTDREGCADGDSVLIEVDVPGLPQPVGNTLRVAKDSSVRDGVLTWSTIDPETVAFRLRRGWPPAPSYPVHGPDLAAPSLTDTGVIGDGRSYAYLVSGLNCTGEEGP